MLRVVRAGSVAIANDLPFAMIARVRRVYQSSFDKAKRTFVSPARGIGVSNGRAFTPRGAVKFSAGPGPYGPVRPA